MFSQGEADALVAAARLAQAWLDPAMALQMEGALGKILSVLPPAARAAAESQALYAPGPGMDDRTQALLMPLREAVQARRIACIDYADEQGRASARRIRPLGCFFWGKVWTVAAWCELRQDFRGFRIDRIAALRVLDERFPCSRAGRWQTCCGRSGARAERVRHARRDGRLQRGPVPDGVKTMQ